MRFTPAGRGGSSKSGYLLFIGDRQLMEQPFDVFKARHGRKPVHPGG